MMNSGVKAKWIDRLRSGDYRQGMGYLNQGDGYCCLGVLCEIAVDEGVIPESKDHKGFGIFDYGQNDTQFPPREVVEWAGLGAADPAVTFTNEFEELADTTLSEMNDAGRTFEEIADLIEEQL